MMLYLTVLAYDLSLDSLLLLANARVTPFSLKYSP